MDLPESALDVMNSAQEAYTEGSVLLPSLSETTHPTSQTDTVTEGPSSSFHNNSTYPGDVIDDTPPTDNTFISYTFPDPFLLVCFFDKDIADGHVTLHPWQMEVNKSLGGANATSKHPFKYCLIAANGSGKDKFVIAPFAVWFALSKIRSRCIITTSSGQQLTSQTEPYIKDLCTKVNAHFGKEVFRIRQRYIKCLDTGSEIRLFVTDEKGKAEGYHPIDANSEMAIIVNEGKSVPEDIHEALRRCTGYNYWLEVSSAGEPKGFFYRAATKWPNVKRITSYDCPHLSKEDLEWDKENDGESSAFFRSKHLSLFTSIGGQTVIPIELINNLFAHPPTFTIKDWPLRIGIDLAAGGDENVICITKGNKCLKEHYFRENDTMLAADRIEEILKDENISKSHEHIYADDGGVGKAIIDNLVHRGWNISRVMNQWAAVGNKKQYGNRGAENWWRCKRILEERMFDISTLSEKTREQLGTRHFKQSLTGGRIFLEDKKEAKAHGRPSPDRADAFILSFTGLTVGEFVAAMPDKVLNTAKDGDDRPRKTFTNPADVLEYYENEVTFGPSNNTNTTIKRRLYNSVRAALSRN